MPELIGEPTQVVAAGEPPKLIEEYVGRANTGDVRLSVAHMRSPAGWAEPGQRPEFDEFTIVLYGALVVDHEGGRMTIRAGQAYMPGRANGCATAARDPTAPSTSRSACPPSPRTRSTATTDRPPAMVYGLAEITHSLVRAEADR